MIGFTQAVLWTILLILAIIFEAVTTALITIWFIPGLIVALILSCLRVPIGIQFLVFVIISILCFIITKPLVTKLVSKKHSNSTNLDALIGEKCLVIEPCKDKFSKGLTKIGDVEWKVSSINDVPLEKGDEVIVREIKGNTLFVEK